ncbi:MAG: phosphoglucosamine mutase [Acidimicrobiia bacterium]|nr:phosphoglucosamine mutase [Acidimicrobiia bacterium]
MLRFGTDGVRGRAYENLFPDDCIRLAQAFTRALTPSSPIIIGRDTRDSSPDFAHALCAGFNAMGIHTIDLGVAPTPAVAWVAATQAAPGVVVSASHNPWHDNGLKLFSPKGLKLDNEIQATLESILSDPDWQPIPTLGTPNRTSDGTGLLQQYQQALTASVNFDANGLKVVVDAANGAATAVLAQPLQAHNLIVTVINANPDGRNINRQCGSTYPDTVAEAVVRHNADLGLTFDGDADRVLAVDHTGAVLDGDQIIAICATDRKQRNKLAGNTVVVTVMTNLGFHRAMAKQQINVVTTPVGDRNVWTALEEGQWALGGEQSGHVIFPELTTTGDGMVTALQLLEVVVRRSVPLKDLAAEAMTKMPQVLHNVKMGPASLDEQHLNSAVAAAEKTLQGNGRLLIRPSGTEPVIRIMVEAETSQLAQSVAADLASAYTAAEQENAKWQ